MADVKGKNSDLPVRAASAVVMIAVAGAALWLGGAVWAGFVALVALGTFWEFATLAKDLAKTGTRLAAWLVGGFVYIGMAALMLFALRLGEYGLATVLVVVLAVIGTDVGAYFAGRTFGGPKIAPAISPSKTWSGLLGGMLGVGGIVGALGTAVVYSPLLGGPGDGSTGIGAQLVTQAAATGATIVWATIGTVIAMYVAKALTGLRVTEEVEREGLDLGEHGERAYNY